MVRKQLLATGIYKIVRSIEKLSVFIQVFLVKIVAFLAKN